MSSRLDPTSAPTRNGRLRANVLASLRHRNYRLFFAGQIVSLVGTWMQRLAMSWLIYRLTNDPLLFGVASFIGQIPMLVLAPLAGVMLDRWDKRHVLIMTQSGAMLQAAVLAALVFAGRADIYLVIFLSFVLGVINTLDMPARQSFVVEMVEDRADLPNAIALNSFMVNIGKIVGPVMAGAFIAAFGEGWCFALNSLSYVGVILAFILMRTKGVQYDAPRRSILREMREGVHYAFGVRHIRSVILLLAVMSIVAMPYTDMMPFVATQIFHGDAHTLGWMRAATGIGAVLGGLWMAARNSAKGLGRIIPVATAGFGTGLIWFALAGSLAVALPALLATGLGLMIHMSSSNTIVQSTVDDDKRGRTMSIYMMAMQGMMPFGSLLSGFLAKAAGVQNMYALCGLLCLVSAALFWTDTLKWRANPCARQLVA